MLATLPLLAGAAVAVTAALPLILVCAFDLLPRGNNGLGLGLLAMLGIWFGLVTAVFGEATLLGLWLVSLVRRYRKRGRSSAGVTTVRRGALSSPPPLPVGAPRMER